MSAAATSLFEALRTQLQVAFPNVIEAAEHKSISYHDPEFFLEVIPRKHGLVLVVDLDFNEVEADDGLAEDASDRSFVMYASHQGGVLVHLRNPTQIDRAMAIVAQARTLT
jgi:predicted transport protein